MTPKVRVWVTRVPHCQQCICTSIIAVHLRWNIINMAALCILCFSDIIKISELLFLEVIDYWLHLFLPVKFNCLPPPYSTNYTKWLLHLMWSIWLGVWTYMQDSWHSPWPGTFTEDEWLSKEQPSLCVDGFRWCVWGKIVNSEIVTIAKQCLSKIWHTPSLMLGF